MKTIATVLALAIAAFWVQASTAVASDRAQPVSDKYSTLYQRVLTRPGAVLQEADGGRTLRQLAPFQVFYVYEQDSEWTKVGTTIEGGFAGYIATPNVLSWSTSIVATFNNRAVNDRGRALIFESEEKFRELMEEEDLVATANAYREAAAADRQSPESGVVSVEPAEYVDIRDRLYILPILDHQRLARLPGRNRGELLKIASLSAKDDPPIGNTAPKPNIKDQIFQFVFVIDTTKSMRPYIEGVRDGISEFAREISNGPVGDAARFGLVEFRDNTELAQGLDYVTKIVLPLKETSTVDVFLEEVSKVRQADASSSGFNEDSLAGLHTAITQLEWDEENASGKFIFLVTDAGPRLEDVDVQELQEEQVRDLADEKQIAITTWHLTTDAGAFDHSSAAQSYQSLSGLGETEAYFEIIGGDRQLFANTVEKTFSDLNTVLEQADQGVLADEIEDEIDPTVRELGLAMQLAYLGAQGGDIPDVFEAYILSQGIPKFGSRTIDVRVMLTRNQLADLTKTVRTIVQEMEDNVLDPTTLFNQMQNALALLAQDGTRIAAGRFEVLGDGAQNFLQALPYASELMELTSEDWVFLGSGGQIEKRETLKSKLRAYEEVYADESLWTALADDAPDGEHVSLLKLDLMP